MIIGTGVDIVEIERIGQAWERFGDRFIARLLTDTERENWLQRGRRLETLAGYWAAKEAVVKALGTGFRHFGFAQIIIEHDRWGRPDVKLTAAAAELGLQLGITEMWLSISHSRACAVASVIATGCAS